MASYTIHGRLRQVMGGLAVGHHAVDSGHKQLPLPPYVRVSFVEITPGSKNVRTNRSLVVMLAVCVDSKPLLDGQDVHQQNQRP